MLSKNSNLGSNFFKIKASISEMIGTITINLIPKSIFNM
ncbi:Hypothetical Protein SLY_0740 [Strawberry lethal yellows phytoplasma (CPA) str. NZSb11]|uniref:Uncharacterized protein n=1 Tax=Strawberry lethal yellows phytoplasma (CPA) str. NZSb11 TaxID=980422 RepID=R4RMU0_PHYAS|nr:Hypothetical Protein SLY_0740 [Strawberry lethal yellows phytoplasma (CPA) str. NZSb11]